MARKLIILMLLFSPLIAEAGWTTARIDRILFYESGNLIYVYPEGGVTNPPECHGSNGDYISFKADRPMAKEYISGLMAAMMAGKKVGFKTLDTCRDQGNSVTLSYFMIHNN